MKKTLVILVLIFTLFGCERNYIKDYKIEGIGLGDSLLDYFSEEQILTNQVLDEDYYKDNEFKESIFNISSDLGNSYDKHELLFKLDMQIEMALSILPDSFYIFNGTNLAIETKYQGKPN